LACLLIRERRCGIHRENGFPNPFLTFYYTYI
jgi:hypothetical protein